MTATPLHTTQSIYALYARGELDALATLTAEDIVYVLYADRDTVPFGGVTIGKRAFIDRLRMIHALFDFLAYDVTGCRQTRDEVHGRVHFHVRHKATGETIEGSMRHIFWLRDGLLARLAEYHDRARIEAFMRLVQHVANTAPGDPD